jgi:GntR family transcriptional repressor for pyruvate dehydrogenase complex
MTPRQLSATRRARGRFAPVSRRSLADDVREQLAGTIRAGTLGPGALIPSEESLCQQFGVSRTSVREAIRELITLGLIERRSNRAYVVEHLPEVRVEADERNERIREVFETRRLLEVQLTEYAAQRASDAQRDEILALAERIRATMSVEELRPLDREFHAAVAVAAGNPLLGELHTKVLEAVFASSRYGGLLSGPEADDVDQVLAESRSVHTVIAQAIAAGDAEAAGDAARRHLDVVERRLTQ